MELRYNENNLLCFFENRSLMASTAQAWLLNNIPLQSSELQTLMKITKTLKATEINKLVSFEDFWDKYDHKAMSSKKKALSRWKNMSKGQRLKAYNYIGIYFAAMPQGVAKKYAETYLNSEVWEK